MKRAFLLCRSDSATATFRLVLFAASFSDNLYFTDALVLDNTSQWTYLDMGVISFRDYLPLDTDDTANQDIILYLDFYPDGAGKWIDLDAVLLLPSV